MRQGSTLPKAPGCSPSVDLEVSDPSSSWHVVLVRSWSHSLNLSGSAPVKRSHPYEPSALRLDTRRQHNHDEPPVAVVSMAFEGPKTHHQTTLSPAQFHRSTAKWFDPGQGR